MAIIRVTTGADIVNAADDVTSLREALAVAGRGGETDRIVFSRAVTNVTVADGIAIPDGASVVIDGDRDGDGWGDVTISGVATMWVFEIAASARAEITGVHFRDLRIDPIMPPGPEPRPPVPSTPGADGTDGADGATIVEAIVAAPIVNHGDLTLRRVSFADIDVLAPNGAPGSPGGDGASGAGGSTPGAGGGAGGSGGAGGQAGSLGGFAMGAVLNLGSMLLGDVGIGRGVVARGGDGGQGGDGGAGGRGGAGAAGISVGAGPGGKGGDGGDGGDGGRGGDGGGAGGASNGFYSEGHQLLTPIGFGSTAPGQAGAPGLGGAGGAAGAGGVGGAGGFGPATSGPNGFAGLDGLEGAAGLDGLEDDFYPFWYGADESGSVSSLLYAGAARAAAREGGGIDVTVVRLGAADAPVSVDWELRFDGTAERADFRGPVRGTVTFEAGGAEARTVRLRALADGVTEGDETFTFRLRSPEAGAGETAGLGTRSLGLTIRDADAPTGDADTLTGTARADVIDGLGGDDAIRGLGGADRLFGGAGKDALHGGAGRDRLFGGDGDDALFGGRGNDRLEGGAGRDRLEGGRGDDLVIGGRGRDHLFGGGGDDVFRFGSAREAGLGRNRDEIGDFRRGDRIDLSRIDADEGRRGDQAFAFLGDDPFTGRAGELRYERGVLRGDVDGDALADFEIALAGAPDLRPGDFLL